MTEIDNTFATIISMLPYDLTEPKPGLTPQEFIIKGKNNNEFGVTIIPNNIFYLVNADPLSDDKNVRNIPVPVPAIELAQSIIHDYVSSLLAVDFPDTIPGIFAIRGNYSNRADISVKFIVELNIYKKSQIKWFQALIDMADDMWSKTRSPISISDLQREACKELGYKRDWLNDIPIELQTKCPFCQNIINPGAIKCMSCNEILDKKKYQELTRV